MSFLRSRFSIAILLALAAPASAQEIAGDVSSGPPPQISFIDADATLLREGDVQAASPGAPLVPGDELRTVNGRLEVLFPDGTALAVDEYSTFELAAPDLLRLTSGRILLAVTGTSNPASAVRFRIDTPTASVQTFGPGEYRVSVLSSPSGAQTEASVMRGSAALTTAGGSIDLRAGEQSIAWNDAAPSYQRPFNSARLDAFDRWASARRVERFGSASAQYLPANLRMYSGALDRNGAWTYEAPYGYVWSPTVADGWRPYYDGYWSDVPTYGWTWIGADFWSWPTHHYGRWGQARNRWFWIPERHWAPAWVSWAGAPGYVSWCPLGFDNRPVFSLSASIGNRWDAWTVLPRDRFGNRHNIRQYSVGPRAFAANTPFVSLSTAPIASRGGGRRGFEGSRITTGTAVPRFAGANPQSRGDRTLSAGSQQVPPSASFARNRDWRNPSQLPDSRYAGDRQRPLQRGDALNHSAAETIRGGIRSRSAVPDQSRGAVAIPRASAPVAPPSSAADNARRRGWYRTSPADPEQPRNTGIIPREPEQSRSTGIVPRRAGPSAQTPAPAVDGGWRAWPQYSRPGWENNRATSGAVPRNPQAVMPPVQQAPPESRPMAVRPMRGYVVAPRSEAAQPEPQAPGRQPEAAVPRFGQSRSAGPGGRQAGQAEQGGQSSSSQPERQHDPASRRPR